MVCDEEIITCNILKIKVTTVKFISEYLYVGMGGNIIVFAVNDGNYISLINRNVLQYHNIYGICPDSSEDNIVVYGGKHVIVLPAYPSNLTDDELTWEAKDWIWHIKWLNDDTLAIILGHNELLILKWHDKSVVRVISCEEKCILYSAFIIGDDVEKNLIVLSGTVYKEVLVWAPDFRKNENSKTVLHRLKGHNDSYLCVWDEQGNNILRQETHQGGSVRCLDFSEKLQLAATGGADGGVHLWPVPKKLSSNFDSALLSFKPSVVPSRIKLMNNNIIVITGRNSSELHMLSDSKWLSVFTDDRILNYCLLEVSVCRKYIALATIHGFLIVLKQTDHKRSLEKILDKKVIDGKIFSVHWISKDTILCCDIKGVLYVCKLIFIKANEQHTKVELSILSQLLLPASKERWLTSAVLCQHSDYQTLICGDRCGSIHVFDLRDSDISGSKQQLMEPVQTLNKIHGRLGVSCIYYFSNYVWSTGRDGYLRKFSLNRTKNEDNTIIYNLIQLSIDKLTLSWAAKIIYNNSLGILVLGFHEVDLVIWSVESRIVLWRLECGGGHREWDCIVNNNEINFYFLKDKSVHLVSRRFKDLAYPPVMEGFHNREVNALSLLTSLKTDRQDLENSGSSVCNEGVIVVSGSEDTSIRISLITENNWQPLLLLTGHLSSVRAITTLPIESKGMIDKFLIFTAGGRAQLKVWTVKIDYNVNPFELKACECCSYMLRGAEKVKRPWREALPMIDPETRFMDLSAEFNFKDTSKQSVLIFAACSDGYLRIFTFYIMSSKIELLCLFEYNRCLLKSFSIKYNKTVNANKATNMVLTTATDGKLTFWNILQEGSISLLTHQSGINSCDCIIIDSLNYQGSYCESERIDKFLLVTGGDDCCVVINVLTLIEDDNKIKKISGWSSNSIHSSQVSGIKIIDNYIISAGVDQRINLLSWKLEKNELIVNFIAQYVSVVADIHGVEAWKHLVDTVAVCIHGVGVEVVHINTKSLNFIKC
ncbi:tRNA (34-2'-O)-methyltransferase regulator WDR6 isoform X2 [Lycorma delicatula]|uniref:tRNA (34-2'-O)-methyltransferase regulator WDR6 isoform X2 n=1 Tax=Lycorma delicatula TaxID=130591 RepID=UPI003F513C43